MRDDKVSTKSLKCPYFKFNKKITKSSNLNKWDPDKNKFVRFLQ